MVVDGRNGICRWAMGAGVNSVNTIIKAAQVQKANVEISRLGDKLKIKIDGFSRPRRF